MDELENLRREFNDFRVDIERRFAEQAMKGQEMFHSALHAIPEEIAQQREDEVKNEMRMLRRREILYIGITAIAATFAIFESLRNILNAFHI